MEKKRREGLLLLEGLGSCLFISLFISLFLYSFPAFHNIGMLPISTPVPERRITALLPPLACSFLALCLISKYEKWRLWEKGCLRVTPEGKSPPQGSTESSATDPIRLARSILSSQKGFVLFNLSVPNYHSPSHILPCSAVELGREKEKKREKNRGKKPAIAFIINPFSCKFPSPMKIHTQICICNQLYSLFL